MNRENLANPVPVEPCAGAALTTTNAPAAHCENCGGVCARPNYVSCTCQCNHLLQTFPHELHPVAENKPIMRCEGHDGLQLIEETSSKH